MQSHHGSCIRNILDPSVLEVRFLVFSLECWFLASGTVKCGFLVASYEGIGELRGEKVMSVSPQLCPLNPRQPRSYLALDMSSAPAAEEESLESHWVMRALWGACLPSLE